MNQTLRFESLQKGQRRQGINLGEEHKPAINHYARGHAFQKPTVTYSTSRLKFLQFYIMEHLSAKNISPS